jgi:hypothetical protein
MYCVDGRHDEGRVAHRRETKRDYWRSRGAKVKTSKRTARWRVRQRKIETDTSRREFAPAPIVQLAERSAVAVTVESSREETSIWMGIAPSAETTRVIAMAGPSNTILKAQLAGDPKPRALATLLEAIALWQGQPVRAALCADARGLSCDSNLCREAFLDDGGALYSVVWVPASAPRQRRRLDGLGNFRDLERLVISEVAR